ncbi:MAG: alpha/beta hydrolase [Labilithrix sp.]|nr:alpha/beta hydrolase [Labilithrix sp.]MCW5817130.1 alpha/beta hydrolase [Labilithrix sp.]
MSLRKKLALASAAVVALGAIAGAVVTRKKTRLRLAYPAGEVTVTRDVTYVEGSTNPKHRLDVYAPKDARGAPVVHFVHGGYWKQGDKSYYALATGLYGSVGEALARRGIVTVVQSYRLTPEVAIDGILDDVLAAMRWTTAHAEEYGGDPKRLYTMGHSAGGHLVALIGTDEALARDVRGTIVLSGVWDVEHMSEDLSADFNAKVTHRTFGTDRAEWKKRSPIERLHPGMAPYFVVVGERDYEYMIPQARRAREELTALGMPPKYVELRDTDHAGVVLAFGARNDPLSDEVAAFVSGPSTPGRASGGTPPDPPARPPSRAPP